VPLLHLVRQALPLDWTRDPFDRLLVAHSRARRVPLCTVDRLILSHHDRVVDEIRARA
jgi:PIN domain nuclease of toxin-antitoxin system